MLDRIAFSMEMANELNMANFQSVSPVMAEYATAASTKGVQVGGANMLADVFSHYTDHQYSVKTYRDRSIIGTITGDAPEPEFTDFIIERRVAGVGDPNADALSVMVDVINDIKANEKTSKEKYNVNHTTSVLLGFDEDPNYFYFRLNEFEYEYPLPDSAHEKQFTERSKNFNKHVGNRSSVVGVIDETVVYEWVHPNNQTFTRCLKKKYNLNKSDPFYFKIKKQKYSRPNDDDLMGMIEL